MVVVMLSHSYLGYEKSFDDFKLYCSLPWMIQIDAYHNYDILSLRGININVYNETVTIAGKDMLRC